MRSAAKFQRVGTHRRWGVQWLCGTRGIPWVLDVDADLQPGDLRVRFLADEEEVSGRPKVHVEEKVDRMQLRRGDFLTHGLPKDAWAARLRSPGPRDRGMLRLADQGWRV